MNGRVYDYNVGRFTSVDPFIQEPTSSQSMNPYSYIMNNPLAGTDPSGYFAFGQQFAHDKFAELACINGNNNQCGGNGNAVQNNASFNIQNSLNGAQVNANSNSQNNVQQGSTGGYEAKGGNNTRGVINDQWNGDKEITEAYATSKEEYGENNGSFKLSEDLSFDYNTSGSKGFHKKVSNYIESLNATVEGNAMLVGLAESGDFINIFETDRSAATTSRGKFDFRWKGTVIGLNTNQNYLPVAFENMRGKSTDSYVLIENVLAHELFHAWRNTRYFRGGPKNLGPPVHGAKAQEVSATRYTNQIRIRQNRGKVRVGYTQFNSPRVDTYEDALKRTQ